MKRRKEDGKRYAATASGDAPATARLTRIASACVAVAVAAVAVAAGLGITALSQINALQSDMVDVVVTTRQVMPGEAIAAGDNVTTKEIPRQYVPQGAIKASEAQSAIGHAANKDIASGAIVTSGDITDAMAATTLSGRLGAGRVAVTVKTDSETGLSGLVCIDDKVDVIGADSGNSVASTLKVVALGGSLSGTSDYTTVTLETDVQTAQAISAAQASEGVRLVLCSATDER